MKFFEMEVIIRTECLYNYKGGDGGVSNARTQL